jgi:hypothetical protein
MSSCRAFPLVQHSLSPARGRQQILPAAFSLERCSRSTLFLLPTLRDPDLLLQLPSAFSPLITRHCFQFGKHAGSMFLPCLALATRHSPLATSYSSFHFGTPRSFLFAKYSPTVGLTPLFPLDASRIRVNHTIYCTCAKTWGYTPFPGSHPRKDVAQKIYHMIYRQT